MRFWGRNWQVRHEAIKFSFVFTTFHQVERVFVLGKLSSVIVLCVCEHHTLQFCLLNVRRCLKVDILGKGVEIPTTTKIIDFSLFPLPCMKSRFFAFREKHSSGAYFNDLFFASTTLHFHRERFFSSIVSRFAGLQFDDGRTIVVLMILNWSTTKNKREWKS